MLYEIIYKMNDLKKNLEKEYARYMTKQKRIGY